LVAQLDMSFRFAKLMVSSIYAQLLHARFVLSIGIIMISLRWS